MNLKDFEVEIKVNTTSYNDQMKEAVKMLGGKMAINNWETTYVYFPLDTPFDVLPVDFTGSTSNKNRIFNNESCQPIQSQGENEMKQVSLPQVFLIAVIQSQSVEKNTHIDHTFVVKPQYIMAKNMETAKIEAARMVSAIAPTEELTVLTERMFR